MTTEFPALATEQEEPSTEPGPVVRWWFSLVTNRRGQFDKRRLCSAVRLLAGEWLLVRRWRTDPARIEQVMDAFRTPTSPGKARAVAILETEQRRRVMMLLRQRSQVHPEGVSSGDIAQFFDALRGIVLDLTVGYAVAFMHIPLRSRAHPQFSGMMRDRSFWSLGHEFDLTPSSPESVAEMERLGLPFRATTKDLIDFRLFIHDTQSARGKRGGRGRILGLHPSQTALKMVLLRDPALANHPVLLARKVGKLAGHGIDRRTAKKYVGRRPAH